MVTEVVYVLAKALAVAACVWLATEACVRAWCAANEGEILLMAVSSDKARFARRHPAMLCVCVANAVARSVTVALAVTVAACWLWGMGE